MKKTTAVFWPSLLFLSVVSAYGWEYIDNWPIEGGNIYVKAGSWIAVTSASVLENRSNEIASFHRNQASQASSAIVRPKPRPRLGVSASPENRETIPISSYNERIEDASRFLTSLVGLFSDPWNAPRKASEAMQWAHEIELECILAIDKQNCIVGIEATTNSPDTAEMARLRKGITPYNEPNAIYDKRCTTDPVEIDRFKSFICSVAPAKLPECLVSLPGNTLRIRLLVKVVKISGTAGVLYSPPPGFLSDANSSEVKSAAVSIEGSGGRTTYTPNPGSFTRPISPEELARHTDVADPAYQYVIGFRYLEGDGLEQNYVLATHWFTKAAEQGYAPAQQQLGFMYSLNYGVPRDYERALYWYKKAADQNNILAIMNMSILYSNGEGVKRDLAEAARWMGKGADLGDPGCQTQLAGDYARGDGVTKDPAEAFRWYMEAALQGNSFAQFNIGTMYEHGEGVSTDQVEALAWYNLAPTNGLDVRTNHRDRLESTLGSDKAAEARLRAEKLREKIMQK